MRVVFFGSSDFSVKSLEALLKVCDILAVVTQPDRKKGRCLKITRTPVKSRAEENGISVFQPERIDDREFISKLKEFNADIFVVVSFGQKLTREILDLPKYCSLNLHSSLLPAYRGAAPINWAIINSEQVTGVSIIRMSEKMDAGDIILAKITQIKDEDNAVILTDKLAGLGAQALLEAIDGIKNNSAVFTPQDEKKVTIARKLKKEDGLINWQDSAKDIFNKARGLIPWPCAFTYYKEKFLKIISAEISAEGMAAGDAVVPGAVIAVEKGKGILVATGDGVLLIKELQLEGKRVMGAYEFVLGQHLQAGEVLGESL
ncbi:MAG: methionyl-tRNA formyltransferase [Candidatus Omnitrophica bacterium]|nr:methionyl-tRNA formyltransferase [Candidatus Omnitrophota bacterium]